MMQGTIAPLNNAEGSWRPAIRQLSIRNCHATGVDSVSIVDRETGEERDRLIALQQVWVMLGSDGSRVHGPRLRIRILSPSHPAVPAALSQQVSWCLVLISVCH